MIIINRASPMPTLTGRPWAHLEFIAWHEARMRELRYPDPVLRELRAARETWLTRYRGRPLGCDGDPCYE